MSISENNNLLTEQVLSLAQGEDDLICLLANTSAVLFEHFSNINWAGFYLIKNSQLVLGPFQGKVACTRIPIGKGVCGTAVHLKKSQLIANVHKFGGHIACDSASNSEVVVNIFKDNEVVAVIDIDSYEFNNFTQDDVKTLETVANILSRLF